MLYGSGQTNLFCRSNSQSTYTTYLLVAHHRVGGLGEAHALHQGLHDVVLLLQSQRPGEAEAGGPAMYMWICMCLIECAFDSTGGAWTGGSQVTRWLISTHVHEQGLPHGELGVEEVLLPDIRLRTYACKEAQTYTRFSLVGYRHNHPRQTPSINIRHPPACAPPRPRPWPLRTARSQRAAPSGPGSGRRAPGRPTSSATWSCLLCFIVVVGLEWGIYI